MESSQAEENEEDPSEIKIVESWSQASENTEQSVEIPMKVDTRDKPLRCTNVITLALIHLI